MSTPVMQGKKKRKSPTIEKGSSSNAKKAKGKKKTKSKVDKDKGASESNKVISSRKTPKKKKRGKKDKQLEIKKVRGKREPGDKRSKKTKKDKTSKIKNVAFIQDSSIVNSNLVPVCYVCKKVFEDGEPQYTCRHCNMKPNHFRCLRDHPRFGLIHQGCIQRNIEAAEKWLKRSLRLGTVEYY